MRKSHLLTFLVFALFSVITVSCEDEVSSIGSSISSSEVTINVDSLYYKLDARTVAAPSIEARTTYNLLGSIDVPEYGRLNCSYVTEFLPSESISIPDTVTSADIDSVKLILSVPKQYVTGDTLAPQQLKVYSLTKILPSDIQSDFKPEGYYDPSTPLTSKSFTLSGYTFNDTTYTTASTVEIKAPLPDVIGRDAVDAYRNNPDIFAWPQEFAKLWPGIYVESSFGNGCIAPVYNTSVFAYYPQTKVSSGTDADGNATVVYKNVPDSVCLFTTAPEVLSSINIQYQPSPLLEEMIANGKNIITTPGGYVVKFTFPASEILNDYWEEEYDLGVINNLHFSIPAKLISNDFNIGLPPALLMVKRSEVDSFFAEGRLPDNLNSFTSIFSSTDYSYTFASMRNYIVDLRKKGKENITADDVEFTLVPVNLTTEDYTDPSTGNTITAITSVRPYSIMPTMVELDLDKALIVFTLSNETLY